MGFWEWMGFENPRDSPKTEQPKEGLPQVTDNVRDSGQTFVFGRSNAGEQVDEKAAMQIPTVYACVRLLAESIAALPLHLYRVTDDNGNKEKARDHPLYKILYRQPNPEMTSFVFWETLMTHLLLWGNAYAQIVRDGKNTVLGLYPLLPENVEVDRDESGELYYCVASRPSIEGETNEDSKEVKTDTLNLQATPLANGYVKAKTGTNTTDDVYNKWYDAVYEPQAEAVDTEDTSHTEEPQG